jgi:hypothetical protein
MFSNYQIVFTNNLPVKYIVVFFWIRAWFRTVFAKVDLIWKNVMIIDLISRDNSLVFGIMKTLVIIYYLDHGISVHIVFKSF